MAVDTSDDVKITRTLSESIAIVDRPVRPERAKRMNLESVMQMNSNLQLGELELKE